MRACLCVCVCVSGRTGGGWVRVGGVKRDTGVTEVVFPARERKKLGRQKGVRKEGRGGVVVVVVVVVVSGEGMY